jgi:hypothetical protein
MTGMASLALAAFSCGQPLTDTRDGRTYATVELGGLCWMARNLDHGREASAEDRTPCGRGKDLLRPRPAELRRLRRPLHVEPGEGRVPRRLAPAGTREDWEAMPTSSWVPPPRARG